MTFAAVPLAGLVLVLLLRPWQCSDRGSREFSALIAASLSALVFLSLCESS
jgi:hypothetical protein